MKLKVTVSALTLAIGCLASTSAYSQAESVAQRVDRLERAFEARQAGQARILQQLNSLQREVSELRGITESHANQLEQILERQRDLYQEIERRLAEPQSTGMDSAGYENADAFDTNTNNAETGYDRAIRLVLEEKRYDQAIPEFQDFIANNPNSEYVGNAHYWLGQLFYVQQNYPEAKSHFSTVVSNHADSTKRADCILKLGMIAAVEGNSAAARRFFEQVNSEYPNSTESGMASRQLQTLSN